METQFNIKIEDISIKSPIAAACMAGISDGGYIEKISEYIGIGILGGYAIDDDTIKAARIMSNEGRNEFLPRNLIEYIKVQKAIVELAGVVPAINIRASEAISLANLVENLGKNLIYEIDAHCRQKPMIDAKSGEYLLLQSSITEQFPAPRAW